MAISFPRRSDLNRCSRSCGDQDDRCLDKVQLAIVQEAERAGL